MLTPDAYILSMLIALLLLGVVISVVSYNTLSTSVEDAEKTKKEDDTFTLLYSGVNTSSYVRINKEKPAEWLNTYLKVRPPNSATLGDLARWYAFGNSAAYIININMIMFITHRANVPKNPYNVYVLKLGQSTPCNLCDIMPQESKRQALMLKMLKVKAQAILEDSARAL